MPYGRHADRRTALPTCVKAPGRRQPVRDVRVLLTPKPSAMSFFRRTSSTLLAAIVYATLFGFALLVYLLRL